MNTIKLCLFLQVWNAVDTEDEVLAMVCRTGLNTQVGSMVRQLASPSLRAHHKDPFIRVSHLHFLLLPSDPPNPLPSPQSALHHALLWLAIN